MYSRVPYMFRTMSLIFTVNMLIAGTIQPETYKSPELKEALAIKKEEAKSPKKNKGPKRVPEEDQIASNLRS